MLPISRLVSMGLPGLGAKSLFRNLRIRMRILDLQLRFVRAVALFCLISAAIRMSMWFQPDYWILLWIGNRGKSFIGMSVPNGTCRLRSYPKNLKDRFTYKMKIKTVVSILMICSIPAIVLIGFMDKQSDRAEKIVPGDSIERVAELLGEAYREENKEGMNLLTFAGNFASAGPILVGFNKKQNAI